jgi:hypothetical protein
VPAPNAIYPTVHDQLVNATILRVAEYNTNNGVVYDLLQSLALNGPAWPWVDAYQHNRDGRGAWKSLLAYYVGDTMHTCSKQECYDAVAKATYQGVKCNFNFGTYVSIHQNAHQGLIRIGESVPEKKVRDFLHGITDPQCSNVKLNVLSNPIYMNNFAQAVNYLASAIDMVTKNLSTSSQQISNHKHLKDNTLDLTVEVDRIRGNMKEVVDEVVDITKVEDEIEVVVEDAVGDAIAMAAKVTSQDRIGR